MDNIELGVQLSKYSTLGIGGKADFLVTGSKMADLLAGLDFAKERKIPFVVIGGGSNVLFADNGFRGLVIINRSSGFEINGNKVTVESGTNFSQLARTTLAAGLVGLHFGYGIPGTIGGAIIGNAGALSWDISRTLVSARVWRDGKIIEMTNADFDFSYRFSKFKGKSDFVILSAEFELEKGETSELEELIHNDLVRRGKSYVGKTCGSYFKNPEGRSAGEIIDKLGLKGYKIGGAEVSPLHANVLRNTGAATASDFLKLENYIVTKVQEEAGLTLEPEVVKVGEF